MIRGLPMPECRDPREDAAASDFLDMVERDRAAGTARSLAEYQARFVGFAARIEKEWAGLGVQGRSAPPPPGRTLGRYRVVRELGRGGQAVVYLAQDPELGRTVALKVLQSEPGWLSEARRERLQREATALARLDHPGICTIYEAQLAGETPFLAMRYVAGEPLAMRLRRAREHPDPRPTVLLGALPDTAARIERVLALCEEIARALHAAHTTGVVHRDVKPGNVMLDADERPVLLDFGLAQTDGSDALALTRSGEIFGSIAYMAPERVSGRGGVDQRSDVYSLGVVLYECLTLERPHAATTAESLLAEIVAGEHRDPVRFNRTLPRDVTLVLQTALEPDPQRRYPSALALAEDLRRLRRNEPIAARPIGPVLRLQRWTRRHPVFAVTVLLMACALTITSVLLLQLTAQRRSQEAWQRVLESVTHGDVGTALGHALAAVPYVPERKLNGPLLQLLGRSPTVLEFTEERIGSNVGRAVFSPDDRHIWLATAHGRLVIADSTTGEVVRQVRVHEPTPAPRSTSPARIPHPFLLAVNPACTEVTTSSLDGRVRRWDVATWTALPLDPMLASANEGIAGSADILWDYPHAPAYSPDARFLALYGRDNSLLVTDLHRGTSWRISDKQGWLSQQVVFHPRRDQLAVRWREFEQEYGASLVQVLDVSTGVEVGRVDLEGHESEYCAFSNDGSKLAVVGAGGVARVFDTTTWCCVQRLVTGGEDSRHLHWVSFVDVGTLVTTGFEGLTVWDLATGTRKAQHVANNRRPFDTGAWNADRSQLAVSVKDGSMRIYDAATWQELARASWHYRFPRDLTWNHAGTRVAFRDGRALRVLAHQPPAPLLRPHRGAVVGVQFASDGAVLTASHDGSAALVDVAFGHRRVTFAHPAAVRSARLSACASRVVTACDDGAVRVWPRAGGEAVVLAPTSSAAVAMRDAWAIDDARVLSLGTDGSAYLFDVATGSCQPLRKHDDTCLCGAFDAELSRIATGGADRRVHVYDWQGRFLRSLDTYFDKRRPVYNIEGQASALAFDAKRRRLLVANRAAADTFLAFDVDTWQRTHVASPDLIEGQRYSVHAAFTPNGRFYATAHSGVGDWSFVHADTLAPRDLGQANMLDTLVSVMRFNPVDDGMLLVAARDGRIHLWDLDAGELHLELRDDHDGVRSAAFSADGKWVATGNQDGTLHIWPTRPLELAREHHARLTGARQR
jgi:WD40 repeat protein